MVTLTAMGNLWLKTYRYSSSSLLGSLCRKPRLLTKKCMIIIKIKCKKYKKANERIIILFFGKIAKINKNKKRLGIYNEYRFNLHSQCLFLFLIFSSKVSHSSDWTQTHSAAKAGLENLSFLPLPPECMPPTSWLLNVFLNTAYEPHILLQFKSTLCSVRAESWPACWRPVSSLPSSFPSLPYCCFYLGHFHPGLYGKGSPETRQRFS